MGEVVGEVSEAEAVTVVEVTVVEVTEEVKGGHIIPQAAQIIPSIYLSPTNLPFIVIYGMRRQPRYLLRLASKQVFPWKQL